MERLVLINKSVENKLNKSKRKWKPSPDYNRCAELFCENVEFHFIDVKVITALIIGIQKIVFRLITLIGDLQIQFHTNGQKLICRRLSE